MDGKALLFYSAKGESMQYEIQHPAFKVQRLSVEATGWLFSTPRLLVNGQPAKPVKGKYTVASDTGVETTIRFKNAYPDPIPKVIVGNEIVALAPALKWYAHAWIILPFSLVAIGGAAGGLCGGIALVANGKILRGDQRALARYGLSGLVTLAAVFMWLAFAILIRLALGAPHS